MLARHGFFSAVCTRQGDGRKLQPIDATRIIVRARVRQHLVNLAERFPKELKDCEILDSLRTDYAYRLFVSKADWSEVVTQLAEEIDYDNFKSAVGRSQGSAGAKYLDALHEVWEVNASAAEMIRHCPEMP